MNVPFLVRAVQCEMCGSETPRTRRILVDRSVMSVCSNCERFGQLLDGPKAKAVARPAGNVPLAMEKRRRQQATRDVFSAQAMQLELVEDYAQRIRTAREKKGWTRQELGGRVGEREVAIGRIENGALHPTDDVARRMERELGIRLFEPVARGATQSQPTRGLTLGDMLRDAARKKKP